MGKVIGVLVSLALVVIFAAIMIISQQAPSQDTKATDLSLIFGASGTPSQQQPHQQQPDNTKTPEESTVEDKLESSISAILKTSKGDITLELYPEVAPKTVSNFVKKAKTGFYNNLTFHRVEDWVVQGGDPEGNGTGGGNIPTEFNDKPYIVGSLGVARRSDPKVQNDAQFFITKTDADWLNNQYTNFGLVKEGMDVVNKLEIGDKIISITVQ